MDSMHAIRISGGRQLRGSIPISGAKNAALPLLCTTLLIDQPLQIRRVPDLADIRTLCSLLSQHGTRVEPGAAGQLTLTTPEILSPVAPYELVSVMRASILVLGPLLARHGCAEVALPGGCAIGSRPVDLHIRAMEALGARVDVVAGNVVATAPRGGLRAGCIQFPRVSVGATENALMAAALAKGTTRLENAAREPEIVDLGELLQSMGVPIRGLGTSTIEIEGQTTLSGCDHSVVADRIEAGTFAVAALITGGELFLEGAHAAHLGALLTLLQQAGAACEVLPGGIKVQGHASRPQGFDIVTGEYPGFPTDLQAPVMALASVAEGCSSITETIFENRFRHIGELMRLGADIQIRGNHATIRGQARLSGARINGTDLRAAAALVLAGLAAEGETHVTGLEYLDRGYERFEAKLCAVGAELRRVTVSG